MSENTTVKAAFDLGVGGSRTLITIRETWRGTVRVSSIVPGTHQGEGYAEGFSEDGTRNPRAWRWVRQHRVRPHRDAMFLDDVIISRGDTGEPVMRGTIPVYLTLTEAIIGDLFAAGQLTVGEFGLRTAEIRRHATACEPTDDSPCDHGEQTCTLWQDVYRSEGTRSMSQPHCQDVCPNSQDGGPVEGIGAEYTDRGTISYLEDDPDLCDRVYGRARAVLLATS